LDDLFQLMLMSLAWCFMRSLSNPVVAVHGTNLASILISQKKHFYLLTSPCHFQIISHCLNRSVGPVLGIFGSPDDPGAYPPPGVAVLDAKGGMQRARSAEPSLGLGVQGTDPKPQEDMGFFAEKMKIFFVHIAQQFNNGTF
jgi:hypothetical protein